MTNFGVELTARTRRYHPQVADDLAAATAFYDNISVDLGNRFRTSLRTQLDKISDHPETFGRIHEQYRAVILDQFPYVILFEHAADEVFVLGIFHADSDRDAWFKRSD